MSTPTRYRPRPGLAQRLDQLTGGADEGRWAFGQEVPDPAAVRALFPSLSPVGQVDCVTVRAPWLDAGGDGWTAPLRGRVVAFVGSNLMRLAPLLGDRLAQAALSDELPSDLTP
jgi:sarcosine oxidase